MIPLSIRRYLERTEKKVKSLQSDDELDLVIHEILQDFSHSLDRIMNHIWESYGDSREGKNKPNIYFPDTDSAQGFSARMDSLGLGKLIEKAPEIWKIIEQTQSFVERPEKWLRKLKKLANLKHERPPNLEEKTRTGLGIGKGRHVYIESLRTDHLGRIVDLRGWESDAENGPRRPLTVEFNRETKKILEDTDMSPDEFIRDCARRVKALAVLIFRERTG